MRDTTNLSKRLPGSRCDEHAPQRPAASLDRRAFLCDVAVGAAAVTLGSRAAPSMAAEPAPGRNPLPRWRGFNLTNFFQALSRGEEGEGMVREDDLRWIRDWGFDFVRLPMDYWMWIDSDWKKTRTMRPDDVLKIKESTMALVDRTVDLCRKYKLHLSLNFHRGPGYCINDPQREPFVLWSDKAAEDAFVFHWDVFAKRYRDVPRDELSLNLVNEAPSPREGYMTRDDYARVMTRATNKIREHSPDRIVIVDGLSVGNQVVGELEPLGVAQSVHAYWPAGISHYHASWVDKDLSFPTPTWPLKNKSGKTEADRQIMDDRYAPWGELARRGIGVHCGECGCFNKTPYDVFLAWMTDVMDVLKGHEIGYALWNFRGSFGILDSGRADIQYEDWHGRQLDRQLLSLLQKY
jgi:aryl-phospho-beta-D-glucosidase BglC (GH1 family)